MIAAALLFLKGVNPRIWFALGALIVLAVGAAAIYHAGGNAPRAELAKLQSDIRIEAEIRVKEDARRESQHQALLKGKDDERTAAVAATADSWSSYVGGLQRSPAGRAGAAAKPVPVVAGRCDDAAGNQDVSAAVSIYRDEVRAAVADARAAADGFRDATAGLLKVCDLQTGALIRVQDWAASEQQINR